MEDGSESSVEILRGQYSISTASYEESREGGLSQLTPVNGKVGVDVCLLTPICRSVFIVVEYI